MPEKEREEVETFFAELGLSRELQQKAAAELITDKDRWADFMMKYELGLEKPDARRATKSALNIGISYIIGGLIPLMPYFFVDNGIEGLKVSAMITIVCLFVFGYFKSRLTGLNPLLGGIRVAVIGTIAAGCAFGIARLIGG
nr:VIT1/CCC1 transporter family protein [uncultured Chitinophaga sp.]